MQKGRKKKEKKKGHDQANVCDCLMEILMSFVFDRFCFVIADQVWSKGHSIKL